MVVILTPLYFLAAGLRVRLERQLGDVCVAPGVAGGRFMALLSSQRSSIHSVVPGEDPAPSQTRFTLAVAASLCPRSGAVKPQPLPGQAGILGRGHWCLGDKDEDLELEDKETRVIQFLGRGEGGEEQVATTRRQFGNSLLETYVSQTKNCLIH